MRADIKGFGLFAVLALTVIVGTLATGVSLYSGESDPKGIRYVCWKGGLCSMDVDKALSVMHHDKNAAKLVVGKSKPELTRKFGYLTPVGQSTPFLRGCYEKSSYRESDAEFLRKGDWLVIFHDGTAGDLLLAKGC